MDFVIDPVSTTALITVLIMFWRSLKMTSKEGTVVDADAAQKFAQAAASAAQQAAAVTQQATTLLERILEMEKEMNKLKKDLYELIQYSKSVEEGNKRLAAQIVSSGNKPVWECPSRPQVLKEFENSERK